MKWLDKDISEQYNVMDNIYKQRGTFIIYDSLEGNYITSKNALL